MSQISTGQTGIWNTVHIDTPLFEDDTTNNTDKVFAPFGNPDFHSQRYFNLC